MNKDENKTYEQLLQEAASEVTYRKICFSGLEYFFESKTHLNCIDSFMLGADWSRRQIEKDTNKLIMAFEKCLRPVCYDESLGIKKFLENTDAEIDEAKKAIVEFRAKYLKVEE